MNSIEIFSIVGAGYVCGLSVFTGFLMRLALKIFVEGHAVWRQVAWVLWMVVSTVTIVATTILLVGYVVVGDEINIGNFWVRFLLFCLGWLAGAFFVFGSMFVLEKKVKLIEVDK